jgi:hypothetical protein
MALSHWGILDMFADAEARGGGNGCTVGIDGGESTLTAIDG